MFVRRRLSRRLLLLVGLIASAALPAPTMAGTSVYVIYVQIQNYCVEGTGPVSSTITVRQRTSSGALKGKAIVASDGAGEFQACFWESIEVGDQIAMTNGAVSRSVTVPNLSMSMTASRVEDVVSGKGPANSQVLLEIFGCQDFVCNSVAGATLNTSSTGAYTRDFTTTYDIRGRDVAIVEWSNSFGDAFVLQKVAPFLYGRFGSANVSGRGYAEKSVTVQLRKANGSVRASFTQVGEIYALAREAFSGGQGAFLNAVVELDTERSPRELLELCQRLEADAQRVREERWGPRTLDVDVLWIDGATVDEPDLVVPHPRMWQRRFVLAPLRDLAPDLVTDEHLAAADGEVRPWP